jgi:hypothetical protein
MQEVRLQEDTEAQEEDLSLVLKALACMGCKGPLTSDDEIVDSYAWGGVYCWSWHQACYKADGGTVDQS